VNVQAVTAATNADVDTPVNTRSTNATEAAAICSIPSANRRRRRCVADMVALALAMIFAYANVNGQKKG
jgi:hypothetical protein